MYEIHTCFGTKFTLAVPGNSHDTSIIILMPTVRYIDTLDAIVREAGDRDLVSPVVYQLLKSWLGLDVGRLVGLTPSPAVELMPSTATQHWSNNLF